MPNAVARPILLLAAAVLLAGCAFDDRAFKVSSPKIVRWTLAEAADGNHYLRLSTKEADAAGNVVLKRDLHPPFRFEVVGGLFGDENLADAQGMSFGTDLEGFSVEPFQFVGVYAQVVPAGISVYGAIRTATTPTTSGATLFTGARKILFVIEHDGSNLALSARNADVAGALTPIATFSAAGMNWPLWPALGVYHIGSDAGVGYDDFRVVSESPPAGLVSAEYAAVRDVYAAVDGQLEALHLADTDVPGALAECRGSLTDLDAAVAKVNALLAAKTAASGPAPSLKLLVSARKALLGVIKKLEAGKGGASAIKGLLKAVQPELWATRLLQGEVD